MVGPEHALKAARQLNRPEYERSPPQLGRLPIILSLVGSD